MLTTDDLYTLIIDNYHELEAIPEDAHLLCPKVDDSDLTSYNAPDEPEDDITAEEKKKRIEDGSRRFGVACKLSLMLGLNAEQVKTWLETWKARLEGCLHKCDQCVRNWHSRRSQFLKEVSDMFDDNVRDVMEKNLNDMDKARIDHALASAEELLKLKGPMTTSQLAKNSPEAAIGLMEALCSMPYLSSPENRVRFNYVFETTQQKRPLKMLGMIPTMTFFLFDSDPYRNRFARVAWENTEPGSLRREDWDWAVQDHLAEAIVRVSFGRGASPTMEKIQNFWEGFLLILRSLSEEQIKHWLRAMDVQPSVYLLALEHCIRVDSAPALAVVLKALRTLMEKSSKAFWAAYDESQVTPKVLVEQIFLSPAFMSLLSASLEPSMMVTEENGPTPALAAWVTAFIKYLSLDRRVDVCESLLRQLFEKYGVAVQGTNESRATCILAGLNALHQTLAGFLDPSAPVDAHTSLIYVNDLINHVVKHQQIVVSSVQLPQEHELTIGRSIVADSVIKCALALDAKAVHVEWDAIHRGTAKPQEVKRKSAEMWQAFSQMLWVAEVKVKVAAPMLTALMPLRSIEQFRPRRGEKLTDALRLDFNDRYHKMAQVVGDILGHLSGFDPSELSQLCDPKHETISPIVALLMHGEEEIRDVATQLVKAITGEEDRENAVRNMLETYFSQFLKAFTDAVSTMTFAEGSHNPWGPMNPILEVSQDVLNGLCDTSSGILRTRDLSKSEIGSVKEWWRVMWRCISFSFKSIRSWHEKVEKAILEDFFRSNMELADKLLAQDGLLTSVFSQQKRNGMSVSDSDDNAATTRAMKEVLIPPNNNSPGIIEMLPIRDYYLVKLAVDIIVKLATRIKENDMTLPHSSVAAIYDYCKKSPKGIYVKKSNLTDVQRAEILKALGADADDTDDDDVQYVASKPVSHGTGAPAKRPTTVPDFFKAQAQSGASLRTNRDDVLDLTKSIEKNKSVLEMMKARAATQTSQPSLPAKPQRDEGKILAERTSIKEARQKAKAEKAKRDAEAIAKARALRQKTVPGEGSGLRGITGVLGKDHSLPQKDEMMVGSSSEDEESEDDDAVLMSRAKAGQKPVSKGQGLPVAPKGPVKKVKVQRTAKDMRARLIPPMHVLHQAILEWDIFHEGNDPPNGYACSNVADTYVGPHDYKQTFFPLLVSEAWRSFVTSKDEATSKPYGIKVLTRMSVDNFMEVTTSMPVALNKDRGLSEGDIVIISKAQDPRTDSEQPHCLARIFKTTYKRDNLEVVYRVSARSRQILPVLLPSAEFFAVKITNMITIEREYAALESLQYYDLMDEVLKAQPSPMLKFGDQAVRDVMNNYNLNTGQAKAILNAKENDGFTLVQGPPGTGKTKTIIAMVGTLLTGVLKANTGAVAVTRPSGVAAQAGTGMPKKLLICAPSNAAVDEIVLRLKGGVKTTTGAFHKISVLRLGRSDAVNAAVKDVTLDELVNTRMNVEVKQNKDFSDYDKMHKEAGAVKQKLAELRAELEAVRLTDASSTECAKLQREIGELRTRQAHMGAKIDNAKGSGNTYAREVEIKRRQIQQEILDKAQVICSTLSGSGHEMFKNLNVEFETVIIDEAAQCVELSALIPLKYGCSKCILVGDPKQLPPTVLSQSAARYGYDQSLFVRMQHNHPEDVHLLDRQYRMHPEISQFPSQEFYEGRLADGADMATLRLQPWHQSSLLGPYRFFDVRGVQTRGSKGQSLVNMQEIKVALQLYQRFRADFGRSVDLKAKIGIITPYKAQLFRLRDEFVNRYGDSITDQIEFNTTDAFQGRECEIIIFSCVRASPTGGIGFMTDIRRMNVGLTRAKSSLWILGDSRALVQGEYWGKLIKDAKSRDRYTDGDVLGMLSRASAMTQGFAAPKSSSASAMDSPKLEALDMKEEKFEPPMAKQDPYELPKMKEEKPDVEMLDSDDYEPRPADSDVKMEGSDDYEPPPAVPVAEAHRVLPPSIPTDYRAPPKPLANTKPGPPQAMKKQHTPSQKLRRPSVPGPAPQGIGGVDERGQVIPAIATSVQRPVINTSPPVTKRHLDANSDHPAAKRLKNAPSVLSRGNPMIPKAPRAYKAPPPPKDPSAMEVLGLAPPTRPPPATAANMANVPRSGPPPPHPSGPPAGNRPGGPPGPPNGPGGNRPGDRPGGPSNGPPQGQPRMRPKKSADLFIKRKPNNGR